MDFNEDEAQESGEPRQNPSGLFVLRLLLLVLLAGACAGLGSAAFFIIRSSEESAFRAQWTSIAEQVTRSFEQSLQGWAQAGVATASFMGGAGAGRFPNVTFPGFASFAEAQLTLCTGRNLAYYPLVSAAQLAGWNAYARVVAPTLGPNITSRLSVFELNATSGRSIASDPSRPFTAPGWQVAPWSGTAIFYDLHSLAGRQAPMDIALAIRNVSVTDITRLVPDRVRNITRASGSLFAPVFDGGDGSNVSAPMVGWVAVTFSWDAFLYSTLPKHFTAVDVVLKSVSSGNMFTIRFSEGNVINVGPGDLHQAGFDDLMVSTSATLGIQYDLMVYPTRELHDQYITYLRVQACAGAVLVIVVLSVVFVLYDFAQRHRAVLMSRWAAVTGRIVGETFPKNVRARLYEHASAPRPAPRQSVSDAGSTRVSIVGAPDGEQMRRWSVGTSTSSVNDGNDTGLSVPGPSRLAEKLLRKAQALLPRSVSAPRASSVSVSAPPIADHFENCTVLFGDLVQFTSWASQVPPERVFTVLEAVFAEFDDAARKHGVFKVETIGDCYMAVTGLPTPSATHAEQMANFALSLGPRLARACVSVGLEPDRLQVRVGLHSGAVTAGIVRADRSRYQLFGDTVNMASRMESTGEASRVQCSGATEALLRATHVLEPRGMVECKGKGMVETFYLTARAGGGRSARVSMDMMDT